MSEPSTLTQVLIPFLPHESVDFFYYIRYYFYYAATTTTTELTTEVTSTEPQPFEYITFNPEFNDVGDSYINRPHLNVAYSTSRAIVRAHFSAWMLMLLPFSKFLLILR
jgi:hypothetical protein